MPRPVIAQVPNFAKGQNEAVDPTLIEANELAAVRNFLPATAAAGQIEKVKFRRQWGYTVGEVKALFSSLTIDSATQMQLVSVVYGTQFATAMPGDMVVRKGVSARILAVTHVFGQSTKQYIRVADSSGFTAGNGAAVIEQAKTVIATGTAISAAGSPPWAVATLTLSGFTAGSLADVAAGDYFYADEAGTLGNPAGGVIAAVDAQAGTVTVTYDTYTSAGWSSCAWQIYRVPEAAELPDDQLALPTGDIFWDRPNGATFATAWRDAPLFDAIEELYYFAGNFYARDSFGEAQTALTKKLYGTPELRVGFRLDDDVTVDDTVGVVVSVSGGYHETSGAGAGAFEVTAEIRPLKTTSTAPARVAGISSVTIDLQSTAQIYLYGRMRFRFLADSADVTLPAGEYELVITAPAATQLNGSFVYFGEPGASVDGWAVLTGSEDAVCPLAEVIVYRPLSEVPAVRSATKALRATRYEERDGVVDAGAASWTPGLTDYPNQAVTYLSDGFSIFGLLRDRDEARLVGVHSNTLMNSSTKVGARIVGSVRDWTTYQDKLLAVGVGGLGILDPASLKKDATGTALQGCRPNLSSRLDTESYAWANAGVNGTAYTYTAATGVVSGITWAAGFSIYDVQPGDAIVDTSTAGSASVLSVDRAAGTFTVDPDLSTILNGAAFTITKRTDVHPPTVTAIWIGGINPGRPFIAVGDAIYWAGAVDDAGNVTQWHLLGYVEFGDSSDKILKGAWAFGRHVLWTRKGRIYVLDGEVPTDPEVSLGSLAAQFLGYVGEVGLVEPTDVDKLFFTTDENRQLWLLDASFAYRRIEDKQLRDAQFVSLRWLKTEQQLWAYSSGRQVSAYNTDATDDSTATAVESGAQSYVWDEGREAWYTVRHPLLDATWSPGYMPTPFVDGRDAWMCGCLVVESATPFIYYHYPYLVLETAGDPDVVFNPSDANNVLAPVNSETYAIDVDAYFVTKRFTFDSLLEAVGFVGQVREVFADAYLTDGENVTLAVIDDEGTEHALGTFSGGTEVFTRAAPVKTYRKPVGAIARMGGFQVKVTVSGHHKERFRNLSVRALQTGQARR